MTGLLAALAIWVLVILIGATLTRPNARARALAIGLAIAGLPAAFLIPPEWIVGRLVVGLLSAMAVGRSLDLALRPHSLDYLARVWMYVAFFDVRHARRGPAELDLDELAWLLGHAGLLVVGGLGVFAWAPSLAGWQFWLVRWSAGVLVCYGLIETIHSSLLIAYRALGIQQVRINDRPIVSTSLVEFWGRRWNRVVAGWLRDFMFFPLARRGYPNLGIAAAFAASTILHFWVSWVPLGGLAGLLMGSFFLVHGAALMVERKLRVAHWRTGLRRGWTIAMVVGTSPLFVEPMLQILAALWP